jgi:uncharacterized protein with HEPN domain
MSTKKPGRDWTLRVRDILACIEKIQAYTAGMTYAQFSADPKTIDAVIRNFEIIGEAAGYIPESFQEQHPDLAWLEMRGMRNIMIHEYFGVSLPIIWRTIEHDLAPLAEGLKRLLDE